MDTRESSLVYLSKIGKTLKPFYDFETKVYGFQNEGRRIKIGFLIVGIIFIACTPTILRLIYNLTNQALN